MRQPINPEESFEKFTHIMAEENIEAGKIIEKIISKFRGNAVNILLFLADMNIRGTQICYLVNTICKGNLEKMFERLITDPSLPQEVNGIAAVAKYPERAKNAENLYIINDRN